MHLFWNSGSSPVTVETDLGGMYMVMETEVLLKGRQTELKNRHLMLDGGVRHVIFCQFSYPRNQSVA